MRILEPMILLAVAALGILSFTKSPRFNRWLFPLACIPPLLILLHLIVEKYRWQMVPMYVLSALLLLVAAFRAVSRKRAPAARHALLKLMLGVFFLVWLAGAAALPALMPVFQLPHPTGPHRIGTRYLLVTDEGRIEPFADDPELNREIPAQVWYPATPQPGARPVPYVEDATLVSTLFAESHGLHWAPFILQHLNLVETHSYLDAPVSDHEGSFPVLIFSHGLGQFYKFNTILMEDLASNGYVVFSIVHAYDTPYAVYPDETIRVFGARRFTGGHTHRTDADPEADRRVTEIFESLQTTRDQEQQRRLYRELYSHLPDWWHLTNQVWVDDIRSFMDQLGSLNAAYFSGRLDLDRIGVLGFSFGGGASGVAAMTDERIKAGVNMDGWQPGHLVDGGMKCPFMIMSSESHAGKFDFFLHHSERAIYDMNIRNTGHSNFNDVAVMAEIPARLAGRAGKIDGRDGLRIVRRYVLEFFEKYLRNVDSCLLDAGCGDYPEVTIRRGSATASG
jgi:predicted dienelactone hydrolase